jgi:hypothetical protein
MVKVTIELCPYGSEENKEVLGTIYISNDGTGTRENGNYNVKIDNEHIKRKTGIEVEHLYRVESFPRLNLGAYDLLYRALKAVVGDRND